MEIQRNIRSYIPGDECAIVGIYNSAFGSTNPYFHRTEESWLWRYLSRPQFDSESILIAEEGGKPVSSLVMTYADLMIAGIPRSIALIDDVATLPKYQKKGHATALVERAIEIANEKGCYAVHLTADPKAFAMKIYEKIGFKTIANLDFMESPLQIYNLAKAVGFRYYIPLLFLNSWLKLKEKHYFKIQIDIISGSKLQKALLTSKEDYLSHNGFIVMDEDYVAWMIEKRPIGEMIGLTATINDEIVGMISISSHRMNGRSGIFQVGNIANLKISDNFWTIEVLRDLLQIARLVAKDTLDCALASVAVDVRDDALKQACIQSRFYPLSHGAAMIHPLMDPSRVLEIKSSLWTQPLETLVADP